MNKYIFLTLFLLTQSLYGQELKWVKTLTVKDSTLPWRLFNLGSDKQGNVILTGIFAHDTLYYENNKKLSQSKELLYEDWFAGVKFMAKFDSEGSVDWAKHLGAGINYLTSYPMFSNGEFSIDSSDQISFGSEFYAMAKLNPDGSFLYSRDSADVKRSNVYRASDKYGNTYITTYFEHTVDFDYGSGATMLTQMDNYCMDIICTDIALGKYDTKGNLVWIKSIQSNNNFGSFPKQIELDLDNNIYVLHTEAYYDFISKFDNNGNLLWIRPVGASLKSFKIFKENIYLTGKENVNEILLVKYDLNGNLVWQQSMTGTNVTMHDMAINKSGLYITGMFKGSFDFNPDNEVESFTSDIDKNYLVKYDLNGNLIWVRLFDIFMENTQIDIDIDGDILLAGHISNTSGNLDFSPNVNSTVSGLYGFFVAKFSQPNEKRSQIITMTQIEDKTDTDEPFEIQAIGGPSGNPVNFKITTVPEAGVASLDRKTITILGPGDVTVWVTQEGNDNYYAAVDVSQTFSVSVVSDVPGPTTFDHKIFPNPAKNEFFILDNLSMISKIEISDLQGKAIIFDADKISETLKVSMPDQKPGVYLIKIFKENIIENRKIIIE